MNIKAIAAFASYEHSRARHVPLNDINARYVTPLPGAARANERKVKVSRSDPRDVSRDETTFRPVGPLRPSNWLRTAITSFGRYLFRISTPFMAQLCGCRLAQ